MARISTKRKPKAQPKRNMVPLSLALAGLGLVLLAIWAVTASTSPKANIAIKGAPRLKVESEKIDRGNIKLGTLIRDDIRVTNIGDQSLRFTEAPFIEVKEGC